MSVENKIQWKIRPGNCSSKKHLISSPVLHHPLQSVNEASFVRDGAKGATPSKKQLFADPLSSILGDPDPLRSFSGTSDPLTQASSEAVEGPQCKGIKNKLDDVILEAEPVVTSWEAHCSELSKFTTKQQLTLASSFLSLPKADKGVVKVQNNIPDRAKGASQTGVERVKARLEQLDSLDEGVGNIGSGGMREMGGLTQEQFSKHLMFLKEEMKEAWNDEQRVKALKITIQCVKSLALSPPEIFYPCKFAIISDLLDSLGSYVHTRLLQLLENPLNPFVTSPKVEAEETARNWFHKVTSIRELLPRIYLEAALFPSYSLLPPEDRKGVLKRLILMCRGLGDPLVGCYIRSYIVHVGLKHLPNDVSHVMTAIEDSIISCQWGWHGNGIEEIDASKEGFERSAIVAERVFYPAFKWLLLALPKNEGNFRTIMTLLGGSKGVPQYVVMKAILKTFPPVLISSHCLTVMQILDNCFALGEDPHDPLFDLASALTECSPSEDKKLNLLNAAWGLVVRIRGIDNYLKAATAWLRFTGINFSINEMDRVLGDIFKRLSRSASTNTKTFDLPLLGLLTTALSCNPNSEELYIYTSFRGLLNIFQRESGGGMMAASHVGEMKRLLETAIHHHKGDFCDPEVVQLLLSLFASLHDGINALTTQDERRQVSQLVNTFIRQVNFGKDYKLQLDFYVDARASFSNLDAVLGALIQHVLRLQVTTLRKVKGHHTGKTAAFERACTAYCFITIPSLTCPLMKLKLYLICGSVAMINNCMGQGDACFKSAIRVILDIASDLSATPGSPALLDGLSSAIANVSAYLVAVPDPPDANRPLYLFRGLVNGLKSLQGVVEASFFCRLNLTVLRGICASARDELPYYLKNVDGNDKLYGGSQELKEEAESIGSELLFNILSAFKEASSSDGSSFDLTYDLVGTILIFGDTSDSKIRNLASSLLCLANRKPGNTRLKKELQDLYTRRTS